MRDLHALLDTTRAADNGAWRRAQVCATPEANQYPRLEACRRWLATSESLGDQWVVASDERRAFLCGRETRGAELEKSESGPTCNARPRPFGVS